MSRLSELFAARRSLGEIALLPYLTAGYPDPASCIELFKAMLQAGADGFEIGVAFSDPMADGLTQQRTNQRALEHGATLHTALDAARAIRREAATAPIMFMSYYNPLLAFGEAEFCGAAVDAGADAVIVPDLPPEESEPLRAACSAAGLDYIFLLGPTSTPERIRMVGRLASGFIYCVSLVGVTGARRNLSSDLPDFLARVRAATSVPLVLGFGISRPEHVQAVREQVDGVIVASALADIIESAAPEDRIGAVAERVRELRAAASNEPVSA